MGEVIKLDQRDVQRKGGLCVKYPSSYVVCETLRSFSIRRVLDVTFGKGRFYKLCRRDIEFLIASDPIRWEWLVIPDAFYQATVWQLYRLLKSGEVRVDGVDCVVADPPRWNPNAEYKKREEYNFLVGTHGLIFEYTSKIADLASSKYILIHYNRVIDIENYTPVRIVEFKWFARYLNTKDKNTSYYVLYGRKD